jgi:hypothetical protein
VPLVSPGLVDCVVSVLVLREVALQVAAPLAGIALGEVQAAPGLISRTSMPIPPVWMSQVRKALSAARRSNWAGE